MIWLLIYLFIGGHYAAYLLGTIDKDPSFSASLMLCMYVLYCAIWPYWLARGVMQGWKSARKDAA